jgi:DUF4097 and DUF4098 domain-containing protein YvlB
MRISQPRLCAVVLGLSATLGVCQAFAGETRKESRVEIVPGGTLTVATGGGSVNLKPGAVNAVVVAYTTHSDKVEVDQTSTADHRRIEVRTHVLSDQKLAADESKVDYEISIPPGVSVTVSTVSAPITADGVSGELNLSSESGQVTVRNASRSHVIMQGVAAPVSLTNLSAARIDIMANGGAVQLTNVWGPKIHVATSSGNISYQGDCSGVGSYWFSTHSGNIDLALPETASVDLAAHSYNGTLENDFPLQKKPHNSSPPPKKGSSFAGTSNSGASAVELQSISGRIRVKKQQ